MFSSNASAGQDGNTLRLVVRPGLTIPVLFHAVVPENSDVPDQVTYAVYLNGKWHDMGVILDAIESGESPVTDMITQFLEENLYSIRSQDMKVKIESEVAQSCPTLSDPKDCSLTSSSIHGIFQARVLEWGAIAFSERARQDLAIKQQLKTSGIAN